MTREEIQVVTESDKEGCETINKLVHKKLGLCWHSWLTSNVTGWSICTRCQESHFVLPMNPDYAHNIKDAWAIKEWLDKHDLKSCHADSLKHVISSQSGLTIVFQYELVWSSPLDRCKAFLLMDIEQ